MCANERARDFLPGHSTNIVLAAGRKQDTHTHTHTLKWEESRTPPPGVALLSLKKKKGPSDRYNTQQSDAHRHRLAGLIVRTHAHRKRENCARSDQLCCASNARTRTTKEEEGGGGAHAPPLLPAHLFCYFTSIKTKPGTTKSAMEP